MFSATIVYVSAPHAEGTVRIVLSSKAQPFLEVISDYLKSEGYVVFHSLARESPERPWRESAAADMLMDAFSEYYEGQTRH